MKNVVIDFESYYDKEVSVTELGTPNYVNAADAYLVGMVIGGKAQCGTVKEMGPLLEQLAKDPTVRPVAANSNFDQAWWEKYFPPFQHDWHCLLDHGVYHQYPRSLAGLVGAVLGDTVDKTIREGMRGKRYQDLTAGHQLKIQEYCMNDCKVEWQCLQKLSPMSLLEEKVAVHTRRVNRRGVAVNTVLVKDDKARLEAMREDALQKIPWHDESPPLSGKALARHCVEHNLPIPKSVAKTDEACMELMTFSPELAELIGHLRRFRRANTMLAKIEALELRLTGQGILPLDLLYCGAPHTRRWSSQGFNIQNLDKEPLFISDKIGSVWTRNWIIPRPGKIFYIADFSQIEPRCLNWLAGNEEMLAGLRNGLSYYEAYARVTKGWKGAPGTLKAEFGKERYTKLKNEALGCGYGMGAAKYTTYAKVSEEEARRIVDGFRRANPKVVQLWRDLDRHIAKAAAESERQLVVDMPSGEPLFHFNVHQNGQRGFESYVVNCGDSFTNRQPRLWGGTLTENVTQRMARDILAEAIVKLEAAGLPVVFTVHDEVVLEVDDDASKEEAKKIAEEILVTAPEWAQDLPLGVEGTFAAAYTK